MTIIERKQLAAHQRRVGPNTVGQLKFKNSFVNKTYHLLPVLTQTRRSFNTLIPTLALRNLIKKAQGHEIPINNLFLNRKAPIIPFNENILSVCKDLKSSHHGANTINIFFKNLEHLTPNKNSKGGIYMFSYKIDPSIFYIGRAKDFQKRLKAHLISDLKDRFHIFANAVG